MSHEKGGNGYLLAMPETEETNLVKVACLVENLNELDAFFLSRKTSRCLKVCLADIINSDILSLPWWLAGESEGSEVVAMVVMVATVAFRLMSVSKCHVASIRLSYLLLGLTILLRNVSNSHCISYNDRTGRGQGNFFIIINSSKSYPRYSLTQTVKDGN